MKYFRMSYEEVVFNRSYLTIMLLNRSIPSFKTDNKDNTSGCNRRRNNSNKSNRQFHKVNGSISANDFFMGMMY
jgi:hypothetical protein